MNTKILKYELSILFIISLICTLIFFHGEKLPDSYLSISSEKSIGFFGYYFSSAVGFLNYYTGLWVLALFSVYLLLYVSLVAKRADIIDLLLILPLTLTTLLLTYFLKPTFVGPGLFQFVSNIFSSIEAGILCLFGIVLTLYCVFRGDLINLLIKFKEINKIQIPENLLKRISYQKNENVTEEIIDNKNVEVIVPENKSTENFNTLPVILEKKTELNENNVEKFEEISNLNGTEIIHEQTTNEIKISDEAYFDIVNLMASKKSDQRFHHPDDKYFQDIIGKIHNKLAEFKIEGRIINVLKGPVVDTFEWELGTGEKISKLTSAAEDLSLALLGAPIRMVYPMKGRGTVGIEVPRNPREIIFLDEIIGSKEFLHTNHQLPLAIGKDAFGEPVIVDLASMPHMLVAGATGAGKSVFINSILVSLLIKKSPAHMKLILIDPKQLELALYAKLPHLIMPVITDAKTASVSLMWAVQEMERRYSIMTQFGVRNIEGFNHKLKRADENYIANIRKFYEYEVDETYELPYIVIIVDEFADLILTQSGKDIENNICRLAAKARAAGIHLIIATQRPSVDVITGLIKSNFPTRVSFRVTSAVDSRTILNSMGAEKLLGKGDMLYKYGVDTTRIHSSFVEEEDIEMLTGKLADIQPTFSEHVMEFLANGGEENSEVITGLPKDGEVGGRDEKYDEAVRVVIEHRSASASLLQRRLGVGYNRAANLIEEMEANGVVGPAQGSKPRKVLLGSEGIS